jgi:hypothetical protein
MSGETLEDYFRHFNLDETRRKFLESMKEGKQQDEELEEHYFKNGNREEFTPVISAKYSIYMKRFAVRHHPYRTLGNL